MPMKRKTKHKGSVPTEYAEVKVNHGIFGKRPKLRDAFL